jgi:hypothetical protein
LLSRSGPSNESDVHGLKLERADFTHVSAM